LNVALVKTSASELALDAMSPIHTLTPEAPRQRLMRMFKRPMRLFNSDKSESPWRLFFLGAHGVDYPNTPGDPSEEVEDLLDSTSNIREKYTSGMAPFLRARAAKASAHENMRQKARYEHMKSRLEYDEYSTEEKSKPESESESESDMVYDSGSCSE